MPIGAGGKEQHRGAWAERAGQPAEGGNVGIWASPAHLPEIHKKSQGRHWTSCSQLGTFKTIFLLFKER